jgi:hypothetical protein
MKRSTKYWMTPTVFAFLYAYFPSIAGASAAPWLSMSLLFAYLGEEGNT